MSAKMWTNWNPQAVLVWLDTCSHFGKQCNISSKGYTVTTGPSDSSPSMYLSRRTENICLHKHHYTNVYSSTTHDSKKGETTVSINWWMDRQNVVEPYHKIVLGDKKWSSNPCCNLDEPWKHAKWKKPGTKGHTQDDAIYRDCPEEADPQRKKQSTGC